MNVGTMAIASIVAKIRKRDNESRDHLWHSPRRRCDQPVPNGLSEPKAADPADETDQKTPNRSCTSVHSLIPVNMMHEQHVEIERQRQQIAALIEQIRKLRGDTATPEAA